MANDKRIYNLDRGFNTQDMVVMIDGDGNTDANSTALTYHVVSTLPATGVDGWVYHLDTVDGLAPIGTYTYSDGWVCLSQVEVMELPNWSNDAIMELISGASYTVSITGNISLVAISLSADGTCRLVLNNPSLYTISTPVAVYSTTFNGLDAISNENVRVSIQLDDGYYEWCVSDRIEIPTPFMPVVNFASQTEVTLPLNSDDGYLYDFNIEWGDGTSSAVTSATDPNATHTYEAGEYTMIISGVCQAWDTYDYGTNIAGSVVHVIQLGDVDWLDLNEAFSGCDSLISFQSGNCDTSNVTNMWYMFESCTSLISLDMSTMDTSGCLDMDNMFYECSALTSIDVSNFDTTLVEDMSYMFYECSALTSVDVSNFKYDSVTTIDYMFAEMSSIETLTIDNLVAPMLTELYVGSVTYETPNLTTLNMRGFDLPNLEDGLEYSFGYIPLLTSIDISNSVVGTHSLDSMFEGCGELVDLNLTGIDFSQTTIMSWTFSECPKLDIDIRDLDLSNVEDISYILAYRNTTTLDLSGLDIPKCTNISGLFHEMTSLTSYDLTGINAPNVNTIRNIASNTLLTHIDFSSFGALTLTDISGMFRECRKLTSYDFGTMDFSGVTTIHTMFRNCESIETISFTGYDFSNVTNIGYAFQSCNMITSMDVSVFGTNMTNIADAFKECWALTSIDLTPFDVSAITGTHRMFQNCTSLTDVDITGWNISSMRWMTDMFDGCTLNTVNYSTMLNVFAGQVTLNDVPFHGGHSLYDGSGVASHRELINVRNWDITDGIAKSAFIVTWHFDEEVELRLPISASWGDEYDCMVDWGDGNVEHLYIQAGKYTRWYHTYQAGDYRMSVVGTFPSWDMGYNTRCEEYLTSVVQMGDVGWRNQRCNQFIDGCPNVTTFNAFPCIIDGITNFDAMFRDASGLQSVSFDQVDTSAITAANNMFAGTPFSDLDPVLDTKFDFSNVTHWWGMFSNMPNLVTADLTEIPFDSAIYIGSLLENCPNLTSVTLPNITNTLTSMNYMFSGSSSLTNVDLTSIDTSNVTNMREVFKNCTSLTTVDVTGLDIGNVTDMQDMFTGCTLTTENYSAMLNEFANQTTLSNVTFGGGLSKYDASAIDARTTLRSRGWMISDGGGSNVIYFNNPVDRGASINLGSINLNTFTVEFQFNNNGSKELSTLFQPCIGKGDYKKTITRKTYYEDRFEIDSGSGSILASDTKFIKVVITKSGGDYKLYSNGELKATADDVNPLDASDWVIGTTPLASSNYALLGGMYDIAIYDYAKSASTITSETYTSPSVADTGIIRLFNGNHSGTTLIDAVGGNDATMINFN